MATFGSLQARLRDNYVMPGGGKMTQIDLANALNQHGVDATQGYVAKIERTDTEPRRDYLRAICHIFDLHPAFVLGLTAVQARLHDDVVRARSAQARTTEAQQASHLIDLFPAEARRHILYIVEVMALAYELKASRHRMQREWNQLWQSVSVPGESPTVAEIQRELFANDPDLLRNSVSFGGALAMDALDNSPQAAEKVDLRSQR